MMNSSEITSVMQLLKWKDVSTKRQRKNGTQIFELPIKYYHGGSKIRMASFKAGYVRKQNGGYCAYQINQRIPETRYYKDYKWNEECTKRTWTGKYNKYVGKTRIPIMDETERLNYLISYCLKNYYIKHANLVANGDFIPKWRHEYDLERVSPPVIGNVSVNINGQRYKVI